MGMLGSLVLCILGALACEGRLGRYHPSLRFWLQALTPLSGVLGVGAALNGMFCVLKMLAYLGFIRLAPMVYLGSLGAGCASLLLGLRFGHGTAMIWVGEQLTPVQRARAEHLHSRLCAHEENLGYAGLCLGLFCLLLNLFK